MYTPAQKLKQEADNLFRQQKYESAALKYGQAIKLDGKNPILFANRALCRLRMKHYMDAGSDASNALRLDPSYAKAHARYAEAHEAMGLCMHAEVGWRRALQALPEHHLTPTELELKGTFERSHTEALHKIQVVDAAVRGNYTDIEAFRIQPGIRAMSVMKQMDPEEAHLADGSAPQMAIAFDDYIKASETIQQIVERRVSAGMMILNPVNLLAMAVMRDFRCTYVWDVTWGYKIDATLRLFNEIEEGWADLKPDDSFRESVLRRLAETGWENTRSALLVTVQCWIIRGTLFDPRSPIKRIEYLTQAIEVMTWGRSIWVDAGVSIDQCGRACSAAFLLATRRLRLEALLEMVETEQDDSKKQEILERLLEEADELIELAESLPADQEEERKVNVRAFRKIPCGIAHGAKAYYYKQKATTADFIVKAFESYLKAAARIPGDDEQHSRYLNTALELLMACGGDVRSQLDMSDRLRMGIRRMLPVWGTGLDFKVANEIADNLDKMDTLRQLLADGKVKVTEQYVWP